MIQAIRRRCWMCGAPAVSGCDAKLVMKAASSRQLDGLGYPVQRGRRLDKVRIEMPRCGSCRSWVSGWIAVLAVVVVMAGIAGTLVQSFVFPAAVAPAWLKVLMALATSEPVSASYLASLLPCWGWHGNASDRGGNRPTPTRLL